MPNIHKYDIFNNYILIPLESLLLVNNLPADFLSNLPVLIIPAAFVFIISQQRHSEYICKKEEQKQ